MKVIKNGVIPPRGWKAINLFGVVFQRNGTGRMTKKELNHEAIHTAQMKELLYVFFYVLYGIEWLVRLFIVGFDVKLAYRAVSFEVEAYGNQADLSYLGSRRHYAQWRGSAGEVSDGD